MSRDTNYQPLNYRKQKTNGGGDLWQVDGQVDIGQAGVLSFYNEEYTGSQMRGIARAASGALTITNLSTGSTVLSDNGGSSPPVFPSNYGTIYLSCSGTMTNGSARLFSGLAGQLLHVRFTVTAAASTASLRIHASGNASGVSGVRLLASTGSDLSTISMRQSAASQAWFDLKCIEDGVWSIVATGGDVTEEYA